MIRILESNQVGRLLARKAARFTEAEAVVRPILDAVRQRGDRALMEYARQFDRLERKSVRVPEPELRAARESLAPDFRAAVETAAANIRAYAQRQMPREWTAQTKPGLKLGQIVRPLDTVAAYIPAGRYPLPSTVMMTVVPAQVAGVPNICIACPKAVDEVFGTAALLGVRHVFQMGGAQAIAAFAFGTRTVPRADRIVGPGNIYVAAAKKLLAGEVGIDFIAGPTEILIIAGDGDPRHYAADMLAQAEHDVDASAILLTTSKRLALAVANEVERQLRTLPTAAVAAKSIAKNSAIMLVRSPEEALEISNRFAPEHLSIPDASLHTRRPPRRQHLRRTLQSRSGRRLRLRAQPRPPHQRSRPPKRRSLRHRLPKSNLRPGTEPSPRSANWPPPSPPWREPKAWKPTPEA